MASQRTPPKTPRPAPAPVTKSPLLSALEAHVDAAAASDFWNGPGAASPLIEDTENPSEQIVTFLWRDIDAEAVLLFVNRLTDESTLEDSLMRHVPDTDIWHLSYRMKKDWRASYSFLRHQRGEQAPWMDADNHVLLRQSLGRGLSDPRNPLQIAGRNGLRHSVVELGDAPPQLWRDERPGIATGILEEREAPGSRPVWVYSPPGATSERKHPVLLFFDGDVWTGTHPVPLTLDNLIADGLIPPCYAVFIDSGSIERRWETLVAEGNGVTWTVEELLPWVRKEYPISESKDDVVVVGQSLGGLSALLALVRYPNAVGNALSQSASLWQHPVVDSESPSLHGARAYVEVGTQEWILLPLQREFIPRLKTTGTDVHEVEFNGGHDYACWRGGIAEGLRWLFAEKTARPSA